MLLECYPLFYLFTYSVFYLVKVVYWLEWDSGATLELLRYELWDYIYIPHFANEERRI